MGIINQSIVVAGIGALPGQNHIIGVTLITSNQRIVGINSCLVSDAQGAIREAGIDHRCAGVNDLRSVDLTQTTSSHSNGHNAVRRVGVAIGYAEITIGFLPGGNQVSAGFVSKEFQHNIILVIAKASGQGIHKGIGSQIGGLRSDGRQSGDDLVVDDVTCRCSAGMCIAIGNISGGTAVLAGVSDLLTQGLLQRRNTGQVLGEQGDIVDPALTTVGSIVAVDRGHGNGYQEGIGGGYDHFGNGSFNDQIQAQLQVSCLGLAIGIGGGHCGSAVSSHVLFQGILDGGGVGFQSGCQSIDQDIGLIEELTGIQLVSVGVTLGTVFHTQCLQEVSALYLVDTIQHFNMVVGTTIIGGFGELDDVSNLQVAELNTLDCVTVACFAVTQIGLVVIIAVALAAQDVHDAGLIHDTGRYIGGVPYAVFLSVGQIVLVDGQRAGAGGINSGILHSRCGNTNRNSQAQYQC